MRIASARSPRTIVAIVASLLVVAALSPLVLKMSVSAEEHEEPNLYSRWSTYGWLGPGGVDIMQALQENTSADGDISGRVTAVYRWNGVTQTWTAFFPAGVGVPGVNDFTTFSAFTAYWIAITPGDPLLFKPADY